MTLTPPRLPRPALPHRAFLTPPDPGTTSPASGFPAMKAMKLVRSSSFQQSLARRKNVGVSMTVNMDLTYGIAVSLSSAPGGAHGDAQRKIEGRAAFGASRSNAMLGMDTIIWPPASRLPEGHLHQSRHRIQHRAVHGSSSTTCHRGLPSICRDTYPWRE